MQYYLKAFKKYAVFSGRATRKEFWFFFLFNFLIGFVLGFIPSFWDGFTGASRTDVDKYAGITLYVYVAAALLPGISIFVRRLHDVGLDGWWVLAPLGFWILAIDAKIQDAASPAYLWLHYVNLAAWVGLYIVCMIDSERGSNRFGPNPKAVAALGAQSGGASIAAEERMT